MVALGVTFLVENDYDYNMLLIWHQNYVIEEWIHDQSSIEWLNDLSLSVPSLIPFFFPAARMSGEALSSICILSANHHRLEVITNNHFDSRSTSKKFCFWKEVINKIVMWFMAEKIARAHTA